MDLANAKWLCLFNGQEYRVAGMKRVAGKECIVAIRGGITHAILVSWVERMIAVGKAEVY